MDKSVYQSSQHLIQVNFLQWLLFFFFFDKAMITIKYCLHICLGQGFAATLVAANANHCIYFVLKKINGRDQI